MFNVSTVAWILVASASIQSFVPVHAEPQVAARANQDKDTDAPSDVADVPSQDLLAGGNEKQRYFLIGARPNAQAANEPPALVVVLPGGDGSAQFNPFLRRIYQNALDDRWLLAQAVAPQWDKDQFQQVVWPTAGLPYAAAQFTTEEFIEAIIADVRTKTKIDERRIFLLGWSSGGPACYAALLRKETQVRGAFIAMSVFRPGQLPSLENAKGKPVYLLQSPDDRITPWRFAEQAEKELTAAGTQVLLKKYAGGHGWQGDVFGMIAAGLKWLEKPEAPQAPKRAPQKAQQPSAGADDGNILLNSSFEEGGKEPAEWQRGAKVDGVVYSWDRNEAQQGKASLCLHKTANRYFPIAEWYQIAERTTDSPVLQVSAQVKAERVSKAVIDVVFLDENGESISHKWAAYIGAKAGQDPPADHDWREYTGKVTIPERARKLQIGFQIYGPGKVWFDAARAEYVKD